MSDWDVLTLLYYTMFPLCPFNRSSRPIPAVIDYWNRHIVKSGDMPSNYTQCNEHIHTVLSSRPTALVRPYNRSKSGNDRRKPASRRRLNSDCTGTGSASGGVKRSASCQPGDSVRRYPWAICGSECLCRVAVGPVS